MRGDFPVQNCNKKDTCVESTSKYRRNKKSFLFIVQKHVIIAGFVAFGEDWFYFLPNRALNRLMGLSENQS